MRLLKTGLVVLALASAVALFAAGPAPAATKPCWERLIDDWYDGRIDGVYAPACYREAIKHAPEDIRAYSDLPSDLTRALQSLPRTTVGKKAYVPSGASGRRDAERDESAESAEASRTLQSDGNERASREDEQAAAPPGVGPNDPKGPVQDVLRDLGPADASSVPIPLLALGGLALLLIAAGAVGLVTRRVHARRAAAGPAEPPSSDG